MAGDLPDDVNPEELPLGDRIKAREEAKKKSKAGRPRTKSTFSPLDKTAQAMAAELSTREGIELRRAELYLRARKGGTALELEFLRVERQLLQEAERALVARESVTSMEELKKQLEAVERQLEGRSGSALRRDMVEAPPRKAGTRDLQ